VLSCGDGATAGNRGRGDEAGSRERRNGQECSAVGGDERSDGGGSGRSLVAGGSSVRESKAEKR